MLVGKLYNELEKNLVVKSTSSENSVIFANVNKETGTIISVYRIDSVCVDSDGDVILVCKKEKDKNDSRRIKDNRKR